MGRDTVPLPGTMPETCGVCGETVPFDATVHAVVHTHSDAGVLDAYVCRPCYETRLEPVFDQEPPAQ